MPAWDPDEAAESWIKEPRFSTNRCRVSRGRDDHVHKRHPSATRTAPLPSTTSTLDIPEGTLAAFVDKSGCDKTTSMRMISG